MDSRVGCCMMSGLQNKLEWHGRLELGDHSSGSFYPMLNFCTVETCAHSH